MNPVYIQFSISESCQILNAVDQWCSNRGPQGSVEWPAKQFLLQRKLNTLII